MIGAVEMARSAYDVYLASPAWRVLRKRASARDGHRRRVCDSPMTRGAPPRYPPFGRWDLDDVAALTTLCGRCHDCLTSLLRTRHYAEQAGPAPQDVVRLTSIIELGDAHGRLQVVELRITGASPLLCHNGQLADPLSPHAKAMPLVSGKRKKTKADHAQLADLEFMGSLYFSGGAPCIPAEMMEAALARAAAQERRSAKMTLPREAKRGLCSASPAHVVALLALVAAAGAFRSEPPNSSLAAVKVWPGIQDTNAWNREGYTSGSQSPWRACSRMTTSF